MLPLWDNQENVPGLDLKLSPEIPGIVPFPCTSGKARSAIIVLPGGGYECRVDHEKFPITNWLNSIGISAFIAEYRVAPYRHPYPSLDARRAIRWVRHHAAEYNIAKNKIGVIGFSAGGHLAGTVGTKFTDDDFALQDAIDRESARPDAMILCYAVLSFMLDKSGTGNNLTGPSPSPELLKQLSCENLVTPDTPPTFLWSTGDDNVVKVENSLTFAKALSQHKVPYEMHIFPHGPHGQSVAEGMPQLRIWLKLCETWLRNLGF
jgi:acetyl esterase/lipase